MNTKYYNLKDNYNVEYIKNCVTEFKNGRIGIFPTDTVYGIGCNCLNISSLKKLYSIKNRNLNKPICMLVSNISMIKNYVKNICPLEQKLMETFWPGPLTIIFDKSDLVPNLLTSNLNTIGIRMPDNKICLDLINKLNVPLATSSANISNMPCTNVVDNIFNDFNHKVDFILDCGKLGSSIPSTIVRVENNNIKILREGAITLDNMKFLEVI